MKNLKKKIHFHINLKSKHLLGIMTLFCGSCIVGTFASGVTTAPLQEAAGLIIVPFEKSFCFIVILMSRFMLKLAYWKYKFNILKVYKLSDSNLLGPHHTLSWGNKVMISLDE